MKISLPCPLGGVFYGPLSDGTIGEQVLCAVDLEYRDEGEPDYYLRTSPYPLEHQQRVLFPEQYLPALELEIPDELLETQPLADIGMHPTDSGCLKGFELTGSSLNFTFSLPDRHRITGGCAALEPVVAPALFSPRTAPSLRESQRALYTLIDGDIHHHFYHPSGAGYADAIQLVEAAEMYAAEHPEIQNLGDTVDAITLSYLTEGRVRGEEGQCHPFERISEARANYLRADMERTPNIRMDITINMDTQQITFRHNALTHGEELSRNITVPVDDARAYLHDTVAETAGTGTEKKQLDAALRDKLTAWQPRQKVPGQGSGPGGALLFADLLHLPIAFGTYIASTTGEDYYSIDGMAEWRLEGKHREQWHDVLSTRATVVQQSNGVVIYLEGADEARLREFSEGLQNLRDAEYQTGPVMLP